MNWSKEVLAALAEAQQKSKVWQLAQDAAIQAKVEELAASMRLHDAIEADDRTKPQADMYIDTQKVGRQFVSKVVVERIFSGGCAVRVFGMMEGSRYVFTWDADEAAYLCDNRRLVFTNKEMT